MLDFKLALKEIFVAAMVSGQALDGLCDGVLGSSVEPLPKNYNKFITISNYRIGAVRVGGMKRKYRELEVDIDCGAVIRAGKKDAETDAEESAYVLASAVGTLLMNNKTLVSTSYPDGVAVISEPIDEVLEHLIYDQVPVAVNTITYFIKMEAL